MVNFEPALEKAEDFHTIFNNLDSLDNFDNFGTGTETANNAYVASFEVRFKSHIKNIGNNHLKFLIMNHSLAFANYNGESNIQVSYDGNLTPCYNDYPSNKCFVKITKSVDQVTNASSIFISYGYNLNELQKSACQSKRLKIKFYLRADGYEGRGLGCEDIEKNEILIRQNQQPEATQCHREFKDYLEQCFVAPSLHDCVFPDRQLAGNSKLSPGNAKSSQKPKLVKLVIESNLFPGLYIHQLPANLFNQNETIRKVRTEMIERFKKIKEIDVAVDEIKLLEYNGDKITASSLSLAILVLRKYDGMQAPNIERVLNCSTVHFLINGSQLP